MISIYLKLKFFIYTLIFVTKSKENSLFMAKKLVFFLCLQYNKRKGNVMPKVLVLLLVFVGSFVFLALALFLSKKIAAFIDDRRSLHIEATSIKDSRSDTDGKKTD